MALSIGPVTLYEGEDGPTDLPLVYTVTGAAQSLSDGTDRYQDTGLLQGPIILTGILENVDGRAALDKMNALVTLTEARQRQTMRWRAYRWTVLITGFKPKVLAASRVSYTIDLFVESSGAAVAAARGSSATQRIAGHIDAVSSYNPLAVPATSSDVGQAALAAARALAGF